MLAPKSVEKLAFSQSPPWSQDEYKWSGRKSETPKNLVEIKHEYTFWYGVRNPGQTAPVTKMVENRPNSCDEFSLRVITFGFYGKNWNIYAIRYIYTIVMHNKYFKSIHPLDFPAFHQIWQKCIPFTFLIPSMPSYSVAYNFIRIWGEFFVSQHFTSHPGTCTLYSIHKLGFYHLHGGEIVTFIFESVLTNITNMNLIKVDYVMFSHQWSANGLKATCLTRLNRLSTDIFLQSKYQHMYMHYD